MLEFFTPTHNAHQTHLKKWGFNVKQQFEDYITRSREIRSLSMPPEETEAHIGEIYRLLNENFAKIKVLLAENKKILERDVFRPLKHTDRLTKEELEEFMDFARALANTRTLEMVDVQQETLLGTLHTIQGYLGEISISEMLKTYVNWLNGADPTQYDWMNVENNLLPVLYTF